MRLQTKNVMKGPTLRHPKNKGCASCCGTCEASGRPGRLQSLAHLSNRLIAQLNATWRVVADPLQWRLQRKKGNSRAKNTGWRARSYCRTKDALLRFIREHCCSLMTARWDALEEDRGMDGAALQQIRALPEWHIDLEERLTTAPSEETIPHSLLMRCRNERRLCRVAAPLCPASRSHVPRRKQDALRAQLEEGRDSRASTQLALKFAAADAFGFPMRQAQQDHANRHRQPR